MKRTRRIGTILVLLAACAAASNARAQALLEGKDGPSDPVAVMLALYTNHPNFTATAKVLLEYKGATNQIPLPIRYAVADGVVASTLDITKLIPECADMFKELGLAETKCVFSTRSNQAVVIYPGKRAFYSVAVPPDRFAPKSVTRKKLSSETKEGHDCEHWLLTVKEANGTTTTVDAWEAGDLNGFPVQLAYTRKYSSTFALVTTEENTRVKVTFDNIRFTKPSHDEFHPAPGYKSYESREALMASPPGK